MKTFKIFTLGCKVNQYETQLLREQLEHCTFKEIDKNSKADLYIINSCTVTHHADRDSMHYINKSFKENPDAKVVITGCLTVLDKQKFDKFGDNLIIIPEKDKIFERLGLKSSVLPKTIISFKGYQRAFVKIQDGCDNFCSYCKVSLVRGRSRSKSKEIVLTEVNKLVKNGFQEIVLTGICLGSYGKDINTNLADLIDELEKISGLLRIRLSSIEAKDISDKLILSIKKSKKFCRHLHIPLQSGDDDILKAMNRKYLSKDFLDLINKLNKNLKCLSITTDVLVGFPGETDLNFNNTCKVIKKIKPFKIHIFPYSPREGTKAFELKSKNNDGIVKKRINSLKLLERKFSNLFIKNQLKKNFSVLFESKSKDGKFWQGYTDNYLKVIVQSNENLEQQILETRLIKVYKEELILGKLNHKLYN